MKTAQDYLSDQLSGECRGGFNSRLQGISLIDTLFNVPAGAQWSDRHYGWHSADGMIKKGEIFSIKDNIEFKCQQDGDAWCCVGEGFVNLQESNNYAFGDTWGEAVDKFISQINSN